MPRQGRPARAGTRLGRQAFGTRFQAAAPLLWTLAAGVLADRSLVEDVLQEAAVIGLRKLDRFDASTSFTAWMARIVRYVALNFARQARRRASELAGPEVLDREPGRPPTSITAIGDDGGGFDDELAAALRTLRPRARACLVLKAVSGLEYTEIAELLGIPAGTAMSHVHRARTAMRERLRPAPANHEVERR